MMRLRRVSVYKMTSIKPELVIIAPGIHFSLRLLKGPLKNIGWKFYIYYCVWVFIVFLIVYFFFVETAGPTLEELAYLS